MTLYMRVTRDKYELPIAVADTKAELARMLKMSYDSVKCGFSRKNKVYAVVEVDDDE